MLYDKQFWKSTLFLALPIALQSLLSSSFSFVDLLMIGTLGDDTIAAIGLAGQISFLQGVFLFGACSGGMIFISQYWGAGNTDGIKRTYGMIMLNCVTIGLLFFLLAFFIPELCMGFYTDNENVIRIGADYLKIVSFSYIGSSFIMGFSFVLRAVERAWIPLITNIISVLTNVFLNYVLIFGNLGFPKLGVRGAAIATIISAFINPVLIFVFAYIGKTVLASKPSEIFAFSRTSFKKYYSIALPVLINEILWSLGMTTYNSIFGHMDNYAALTISKTVENIVFVLFVGLCNACAVLIGKYIGIGKINTAKEYAKRFLLLVPLIGFFAGLAVILLRKNILGFFSTSEGVRDLTFILLLIYGLELGIRNISYICVVGIFRAGGDTKTGMYYDLFCLWFIGLPATFISANFFNISFAAIFAIMLFSEDTIKTILCLRYFKSMKWIKPVNN